MADENKVLDLAKIKAIADRYIDRSENGALAKGMKPGPTETLALTLVELCDYVGGVEAGVLRILEGAGKTIAALRADVDALKGGSGAASAPAAAAAAGPAASAAPAVETEGDGTMTPDEEAAAVAYVMGGLPGNESGRVDPAVAAAALGKKA